MATLTHAALVQRARHWLSGTAGCRFVLTEVKTQFTGEQPDAIGWKGTDSYVVECKVSRADFFADRKKSAAQSGCRMGAHRFYLTPAGLLRPEEVPEPWGLLEVHGPRIRQVLRPLAFNRPRIEPPERDWGSELALLLAAAQGVSATMRRNMQEMAVASHPDHTDPSQRSARSVDNAVP